MEAGGKQVIYHWKQLWETWDLQLVILCSLFLQIFLIFSAPLRKRTSNVYIIIPMWLAYSLADPTANFAVGLISRSPSNLSGASANLELLAFWAPFLLLHLGGPDTITSFALEDNELWLRHLLQLVFQCGITAYVLIVTLSSKNKLWLPTLLVFVAGFIKYTERTRSLNLASWHKFRNSLLREPDPGPNYDKLMDAYFSKNEAKLPTRIEFVPVPRRRYVKAIHEGRETPLDDLDVVVHGYRFFQTFKGLLADLIYGFRERDRSRTFFLQSTAGDAFKVVEVELNFLYEILHTKARVVRSKYGYTLRFVSFILIVTALMLFYFIDKDKQGFHKLDVELTYTLLLAVIALDLISLPMLLFSDWTVVTLDKSGIIMKSVSFMHRKMWSGDSKEQSTCSFGWFMQILRRRWSERISQYNLIHYCLHPHSGKKKKIVDCLGLSDILHGMKYIKKERFSITLRDFIFHELREKSLMADDIETGMDICSAKGDWVLRIERCDTLLPFIIGTDYDESIILWHIATELCYNEDEGNDKNKDFRTISKLLSDYMLYLLILQPTMMSAVAGIGHVRFRDTCAEAKRFFDERGITKKPEENQRCLNIPRVDKCFCRRKSKQVVKPDEEQTILACKSILAVNTKAKPVTIKGDKSKSVLFDACRLAKELRKLEGEKKWEIMSKVWVELLSYAACHCRSSDHAAQLSKGGQLISLVWLLMAHLGLGYQFQISEGHARLKIVVNK
ncbi:hypothetical protein CsSME_00030638 [Camellia sinensis var. sinensis]